MPLAAAAAVSALVVAVGILGRATGSFLIALCVGTLATAAAGVAWTVRGRRPAEGHEPAEEPRPASRRWMWPSGLVAVLPVAFLTLAADFFDDFNPVGHRSLIAQFQNDVFPPRHQVFTDYPFRYHYGFNLVAAALTALTRLPVPWAIDLLVIAGFLWSWCLAWRLGERLTRSRNGAWTAMAALLGGGAFFWFVAYADWGDDAAVGRVVGGNRLNFPVVMYFFQKPFALGIPLALALMIVASAPARAGRFWRRASLLTTLLGGLYLVQEALFVTVGLSLAAQEVVTERRLRALAPFALALGLAVALGGLLFSPMPPGDGALLRLRFWPAQSGAGGVFAWYFLTTGLLVPLGLLGLRVMPALRTFFFLLIAGSFAAPLFFEDPFAWDIVKLATVGQLVAGVAAGSALAWLAEKRGFAPRGGLVVATVLLVASPAGYLAYWVREVVSPTAQIGQLLALQRQVPRNADWEALTGWLRRHATGATVYTVNPRLMQHVLLAGLGSAAPPRWEDRQFGIPQARISRREALLQEAPPDVRRWIAEGVGWIVIGPGEPMEPAVARWVAAGQARVVKVSGPWRLCRLTAPAPAPP